MFTIDFYGSRTLAIGVDRYLNDRLAVQLYENGEPFATASVNLPGEALGPEEFAFKTYSENEGLFEELVRVGAIEFAGRHTAAMSLPICRLTSAAASASQCSCGKSKSPGEHLCGPCIADLPF